MGIATSRGAPPRTPCGFAFRRNRATSSIPASTSAPDAGAPGRSPRGREGPLSRNEKPPRATNAHRLGLAEAERRDRDSNPAPRRDEHRIGVTIPNEPRAITGPQRPTHGQAEPAADGPPADPQRTKQHPEHEE